MTTGIQRSLHGFTLGSFGWMPGRKWESHCISVFHFWIPLMYYHCMCGCSSLCHVRGDQRTAFGSHCSPSFHHLVPGIEPGSSGLAASALTPWALSAALYFNFLKNCHIALPSGCTRLCPHSSTQEFKFLCVLFVCAFIWKPLLQLWRSISLWLDLHFFFKCFCWAFMYLLWRNVS